MIATLVNADMAKMYELQTIYGVQDAYDLFEIAAVATHNEGVIRKWQES